MAWFLMPLNIIYYNIIFVTWYVTMSCFSRSPIMNMTQHEFGTIFAEYIFSDGCFSVNC